MLNVSFVDRNRKYGKNYGNRKSGQTPHATGVSASALDATRPASGDEVLDF